MYNDLDSTDIVASKGGLMLYVQTDHRTAPEIEADRDMSTVYAMVRVLNAARMARGRGERFKVHYSNENQVPDFLHQAIDAAGGVFTVGLKEKTYRGPRADPSMLLDEVLGKIGTAVAQRMGADLSPASLGVVEDRYAALRPGPDVDRESYWRAVVELGAFAGEVLRRLRGGGWTVFEEPISSLPVVFDCRGKIVNLMGKAIKLYANGKQDSLAGMVEAVCRMIDEEGIPPAPPRARTAPAPPPKPGFFGRLLGK